MVHPAVIELEVSAVETLDRQAAVRIVGTGGEGLAHGIGLGDDRIGGVRAVTLVDQVLDIGPKGTRRLEIPHAEVHVALLLDDRGVGLLGIDTLLVVHDPRLPEEVAGEELDIEPGAAQQFLRNRLIEVDGHEEAFALRLERDGVGHPIIRIDHRIEAGVVAAGIREAEGGDDLVAVDLAAQLLRDGLPLTWCRIETDVAVAGDAVPVHQHGNTPLVAFGIEVVECHYVHSVLVEITGGVDVEVLGSQPRSAQQRDERERQSFQRHDSINDWCTRVNIDKNWEFCRLFLTSYQ